VFKDHLNVKTLTLALELKHFHVIARKTRISAVAKKAKYYDYKKIYYINTL